MAGAHCEYTVACYGKTYGDEGGMCCRVGTGDPGASGNGIEDRAHVAQLVVTLVRIGCKLLYKIGKAHVDPFRKVTIVNVWTQ